MSQPNIVDLNLNETFIDYYRVSALRSCSRNEASAVKSNVKRHYFQRQVHIHFMGTHLWLLCIGKKKIQQTQYSSTDLTMQHIFKLIRILVQLLPGERMCKTQSKIL